MKFTVERDVLLGILKHAHSIVVRQDNTPVLASILISATDGRLTVKATNTDILAQTGCPADVEATGDGCVPLEPLFKLLQRLPARSVIVANGLSGSGMIEMRCGRSSFELPVLSASGFPDFPAGEEAGEVEVEGSLLAQAIGVPLHCADAADQRVFVNGVHIGPTADGTTLLGIATNGKRITRALLPLPAGWADLPAVMIAVKPAEEIVKLARAAKGPVKLRIGTSLLSASADDVVLTTKLLDARMPDCSQFFPPAFDGAVAFPAGQVIETLHRAEILADDQYRMVRIDVSGGELSIASRSTKGGAITDTLEVEGGDGIGFNGNVRMLREGLEAVGGDVVELFHAGPGAPIVMRARGGGPITALVMPTLA
ncbi:DNA polymerase-3 subunit beta [Methylobacterium sp. OAE515]|uniref:DNA polymerase III subunit beta n=1 Tax=Methylobacterium sp. OAE515 TaxID=2817895 RepID=UPI00178B8614